MDEKQKIFELVVTLTSCPDGSFDHDFEIRRFVELPDEPFRLAMVDSLLRAVSLAKGADLQSGEWVHSHDLQEN